MTDRGRLNAKYLTLYGDHISFFSPKVVNIYSIYTIVKVQPTPQKQTTPKTHICSFVLLVAPNCFNSVPCQMHRVISDFFFFFYPSPTHSADLASGLFLKVCVGSGGGGLHTSASQKDRERVEGSGGRRGRVQGSVTSCTHRVGVWMKWGGTSAVGGPGIVFFPWSTTPPPAPPRSPLWTLTETSHSFLLTHSLARSLTYSLWLPCRERSGLAQFHSTGPVCFQ